MSWQFRLVIPANLVEPLARQSQRITFYKANGIARPVGLAGFVKDNPTGCGMLIDRLDFQVIPKLFVCRETLTLSIKQEDLSIRRYEQMGVAMQR